MSKNTIHISQLQIGIYVELKTSWLDHNFLRNNFKIKNQSQLSEIRKLGIKHIHYDPDRSDVEPLPLQGSETKTSTKDHSTAKKPTTCAEDSVKNKSANDKEIRIKKLKERRVGIKRCNKIYEQAVGSVRKMMKNLQSQPKLAIQNADEIVSNMVTNLMHSEDATLQLVNMKGTNESTYYHSMNVFILSMMLGKQLHLTKKQMQDLGKGALLHDLGHTQVPTKILRSKEPLTKPEQSLFEMHTIYGERMASQLGELNNEVIAIISQHHEMCDGSGYPKGLVKKDISLLARVVAIVNYYDNLCNNTKGKPLSPHEAMSYMYAKKKELFDGGILSLFINKMGVYPPGTFVTLDDKSIATVIAINPDALLKPILMVYDPKVRSSEAPIINLVEEKRTIVNSINRVNVQTEILNYFHVGETINYYVSSPKKNDGFTV